MKILMSSYEWKLNVFQKDFHTPAVMVLPLVFLAEVKEQVEQAVGEDEMVRLVLGVHLDVKLG